jgi:hypothetical protein
MISKAAGTLDANDQNALVSLENELLSFKEHMFRHAELEEKFIHPILSERVPGGASRLNEDHKILHKQFDDLIACFGEIKKKQTDFEKREELSLEFYLAWNRFTSFYFNHIDYEEEYVMPSLWKLCTFDELFGVFRKSLADQALEEIIYAFIMALPAMSPTERVMIINQGRAVGPPEAFQAAIKIAEHVLTPTDFSSLKKALNLEG